MPAIDSFVRLEFDLPLAPKAGKPIAVAELLKRLKTLHEALAAFEQGAVELSSLQRVAKDLISSNLLNHKDKGVRAYVACCLADILRLFVPDAPYTAQQLQSIFEHFVVQLQGLADPESPYHSQYCYLLESLSQVKSIVLVCDLANGEDLLTDIFQMFFDMTRPDGLKNIEFHMSEILVQLVDEAATVPQEVVNMILAQFLRPAVNSANGSASVGIGKASKKVQTSIYQPPTAYNMAKKICNNCADRMSRYVSQYFTDAIYEISSKVSSEDVSEADLSELRKAHNLMVEIWKAAPEVLQSVIPQLEQEVLVDSLQMRLLATRTIGLIAGEVPGRVNFISSHATCWESWLGRKNDKSYQVRAKWAEGCAYIIGNRTDVVKGTVEGLGEKLIDTDDKVRLSACKAIGNLDYKTVVRKFRDPTTLSNLAERVKDRKTSVRAQAIPVLGNLYDFAYDDIAAQDDEIVTQLGWIPSRIYDLYYLNNAETNVFIDHCINEQILPFENDDTKRVSRLLTVMKYLEEKPRKAFNAVASRQKGLAVVLTPFIELCEKYNGGVTDADEDLKGSLDKIINWLKDLLPDPTKALDNLNKFINLNDRRLYKLLKDSISLESDIKLVYKSINEFKLKLNQSMPAISETMVPLLYRSGAIQYNKSNIPPILEISKHTGNPLSGIAHELLKDISASMPAILKTHIQEITNEIQNNATGFEGSVDTLKACAQFAKQFPQDLPQDRQFLESLSKFATEGSPKEAKHAVQIILQSKKKHSYARDLLRASVNLDIKNAHLLAQMATLAELVHGAPTIVEPEIDKITEFLIKTVLLQNRVVATPDDKDWVEDAMLDDDCKAKILALEILINRSRAAEDVNTAKVIAQPVLKLLNSLIVNEGEMSPEQDTPLYIKSRLRLAGGLLLLKLAKLPIYEALIEPETMNRLVLLVQDKDFQVRQIFLDRLKKYLASDVLPERYLPLLFLVAYEPEEEVKDDLITWVRARMIKQQQQTTVMERSFSRLLHLLAHHPDYGTEVADLLDFAQYIIFYLNAVVTEANISLIFYFAQRVKQVRDAVSDNTSENLYYLSDLAQTIIRLYEEAHGWSMQTWPGKVPLPADLFKALPSTAIAQKIARTTYLPDGVAEKLTGLVKARTPRARPVPIEKTSNSVSSSGGRKKRKSSEDGTRKKSKVRKAPESDDEWDGK